MPKVFQYGSNTSIKRINSPTRLDGYAKYSSVVRTVDVYDFRFLLWSKTNNCAAADIVKGSESAIYGVLYDIPDYKIFRSQCLAGSTCLDKIEGNGNILLKAIKRTKNFDENYIKWEKPKK